MIHLVGAGSPAIWFDLSIVFNHTTPTACTADCDLLGGVWAHDGSPFDDHSFMDDITVRPNPLCVNMESSGHVVYRNTVTDCNANKQRVCEYSCGEYQDRND